MAAQYVVSCADNDNINITYDLVGLSYVNHNFGASQVRSSVATDFAGTWVVVGTGAAGVGKIDYGNGVTWNSASPITGTWNLTNFQTVMWDGNRFLGIAQSGGLGVSEVWQSPFGDTWTKISTGYVDPGYDRAKGIVWDGERYLLTHKAAEFDNRGHLLVSDDAVTWTEKLVANSGGFFHYFDMAPATNGSISLVCDTFECFSSIDGFDSYTTTDIRTALGFSPYILSMTWDGTNFVGYGYDMDTNGDYGFVTPDGVTWNAYTWGTSSNYNFPVVWDGTHYWMGGVDGLYRSTDMTSAPSLIVSANGLTYGGLASNPAPQIIIQPPDDDIITVSSNPVPVGMGSIPM